MPMASPSMRLPLKVREARRCGVANAERPYAHGVELRAQDYPFMRGNSHDARRAGTHVGVPFRLVIDLPNRSVAIAADAISTGR
jgi:hypothetical protein